MELSSCSQMNAGKSAILRKSQRWNKNLSHEYWNDDMPTSARQRGFINDWKLELIGKINVYATLQSAGIRKSWNRLTTQLWN